MFIQDISVIDLEGQESKVNLLKSSNSIPKLAQNVPVKTTFIFKDVVGEPMIVKLFRFSTRNEPEGRALKWTNSKLEFRDLKVNWN